MEEDIKGKFITRTKENGIKYKLYVPENVNADTPVFTYAYGTGDPGIEKCVLENGSDSVFIMTIVDWDADLGTITMNIVNEVKQEFGITSTTVTPSGFSLGGFAGYETAAENIRQNPDCEPQTVFLIDTYGTIFYNPKLHLDDTDTLNLFKENQTVFFALDHPLKTSDINTLYAKAGLNIIQVKCLGQGHGDINASFFTEGMYDYMAGHALPKDGYVYSVYNQETGEWEEIPYEEIATKIDLDNYFNLDTFETNLNRLYSLPDITVKSNDKTLESYMNDIRQAIRSTSFLGANFNIPSYSSTTQVPTAIPGVVNNYFSMTSSLLSKIATKTANIARIAGEIELLDQNLAKRAENVNQTNPLYTVSTHVPERKITHGIMPNEDIVDTVLTPPEVNENIETLSPQEQPKDEPGTTPVVPPTLPDSNDDNDEESQPEKPSGGDNNNNNQPDNPTEELPLEEQFPKYEELYSDENKTVYNYNDEYKVVVHHEDGKITGVEHYYDFKTTEEATAAVKKLETTYKDVENFDKVIQKDRYVKVLFKEDMYKNIKLDKFKENYKDLEKVLKNK